MSFVEEEIASQPDCWREAATVAPTVGAALPRAGERVLVVGCGTSWFVAQCYAALREAAGLGETDACTASEALEDRAYDRVVAISRSGTTTEVLEFLLRWGGRTPAAALTAVPNAPVAGLATDLIVLPFADERSVVQTRFATTALMLLRAHLGHDLAAAIRDAEAALVASLPSRAIDRTQFTFLGRGWTVGLAHEAALKMREASQAWSESYPAMEYRHGPISVADERSLVWMLGEAPNGLERDVVATGADWLQSTRDPVAELIRTQRLAIALSAARGLDADRPRNLTRSVILDPAKA